MSSSSASSQGKLDFVQQEQDVLKYWDQIDAFHTSSKLSAGAPEYVFYDGPPFATGAPHYGHILAGTIKDAVCRYWYMRGRNVERRFGWDTHGLPIEFEINKLHGIKTTQDVLDIGIGEYNRRCRDVVMRCAEDWRRTITRLGRWIDFDNDYRTMYPSFMESLWWVFARLWEKDLVYHSEKVVAYSTECTTPLSNFETNLAYKSRNDPEVYVLFHHQPEAIDAGANPAAESSSEQMDTFFVAWTTTPWTLPSNLALCVHPDLLYVVVRDRQSNRQYVLLQSRLDTVFSEATTPRLDQLEIVRILPGAALVGWRYTPLFPYFTRDYADRAFRVVADAYVREDSGSGIVHQAPAFGEDDFRVCTQHGIVAPTQLRLPCPLDPNARFTAQVPEFEGMQVFDANPLIVKHLKACGRVLRSGSIVHSYPHCWRSGTPLIYRSISCWFIRVEVIREALQRNNSETRWVPAAVNRRFDNWLATTTDWAVSRNRFWGTPLPVWANEDLTDVVVVRSIEHLYELSGVRITDLHRESIDHIVFPSPTTGKPLRRIEEVFDCWFESGAMPYAQCHYPFENADRFTDKFPADFIAEGLDQTRGWFYTLLILSTALFDRPAFKNVIVNGIVLAADGRKMSKSLKNYPDPELMLNKYGADAVRLYLINSPLLRAQEIKFREEGLAEVIQEIFVPWYNSFRFFQLACDEHAAAQGRPFVAEEGVAAQSANITDRWILATLQSLVQLMRTEMESYHLYRVTPHLVRFIEALTNLYVRLNRTRLKGHQQGGDQRAALNTLFEVLFSLCKLMAPITPFITESLYQQLRQYAPPAAAATPLGQQRAQSVHFQRMPDAQEAAETDRRVLEAVEVFRQVLVATRRARDRRNRPLKVPLAELVVLVGDDAVARVLREQLAEYLTSELNAARLSIVSDLSQVRRSVVPNAQAFGRKKAAYLQTLRAGWQATMDARSVKAMVTQTQRAIDAAVAGLSDADARAFQESGAHALREYPIALELSDVVFAYHYEPRSANDVAEGSSHEHAKERNGKQQIADWAVETISADLIVAVNFQTNNEIEEEGIVRELMSCVQALRKAANLRALDDQIGAYFEPGDGASGQVARVCASKQSEISRRLRYQFSPASERQEQQRLIIEKENVIAGEKITLSLAFTQGSLH